MAWNNGFPATYAPMYPQQYNPYLQQQTQPQMTPPTIRAEIVQVDDEAAASAFPVGAGASQMMIARDESAIYIKTATANGQTALEVFQKRPPEPPAPAFNPAEYVRKDEIETLVSAAIAAQAGTSSAKRVSVKKEEA